MDSKILASRSFDCLGTSSVTAPASAIPPPRVGYILTPKGHGDNARTNVAQSAGHELRLRGMCPVRSSCSQYVLTAAAERQGQGTAFRAGKRRISRACDPRRFNKVARKRRDTWPTDSSNVKLGDYKMGSHVVDHAVPTC